MEPSTYVCDHDAQHPTTRRPFFSLDEVLMGKTFVMSGGSRQGGISRRAVEMAICFGARVAFIDKDPIDANFLNGLPAGKALYFRGDLRQPETAQEFLAQVVNEFGLPNVVVNIAGGSDGICNFQDVSYNELISVFEVNVGTASNLVSAALPFLMRQSGDKSIVSIGSVTGLVTGDLREAHYGAAKAALASLAKSWANEFAPFGIRSNLIASGSVPNPFSKVWNPRLNDPRCHEHILDRIPLGRLGTPEDIGNCILFLASPLSSWITGQVVCVDGGMIFAGRGDIRPDGKWYLPREDDQFVQRSYDLDRSHDPETTAAAGSGMRSEGGKS